MAVFASFSGSLLYIFPLCYYFLCRFPSFLRVLVRLSLMVVSPLVIPLILSFVKFVFALQFGHGSSQYNKARHKQLVKIARELEEPLPALVSGQLISSREIFSLGLRDHQQFPFRAVILRFWFYCSGYDHGRFDSSPSIELKPNLQLTSHIFNSGELSCSINNRARVWVVRPSLARSGTGR